MRSRLAAVSLLSFMLAGCDLAVDGHGGLDFGVAAGQANDQWTRTYNLPAGGRLEVINVNGRITAEPADGSAVELRADRSAKAASDEVARELLARIEMREEVGDSRVRVEVRVPRGSSRHEIKWTVRVPRNVAVDLRTVNGGVTMARLEGEVRARSTNGGIVGERLAATSVDAAVTNGGVEIELTRPVDRGSFQLEATNGGVQLSLPQESRADITGRCVNGGIEVLELPVEVLGEKTRRRLDAKLNGGGARISLETVNGGVRLSRSNTVGS
jgi:hypothetical protein